VSRRSTPSAARHPWWDRAGPEESEVTFSVEEIPAGTRLVVTETAVLRLGLGAGGVCAEDSVFSALSDRATAACSRRSQL
jgi:hypothetical protein